MLNVFILNILPRVTPFHYLICAIDELDDQFPIHNSVATALNDGTFGCMLNSLS